MKRLNRIGVVVQGPLISRGLTGRSQVTRDPDGRARDLVTYNAVENVLTMYEDFGGAFDFVCATWRSEPQDLLQAVAANLPREALLTLDDVSTIDGIPRDTAGKVDNKYRQSYSTLKGLEVLANRGCTLVIKVRTDQWVDVEGVARCLTSDVHDPEWFALVAWFNSTYPWNLPDFIFGGPTTRLLNVLRQHLASQQLARNVHQDLFLRWGTEVRGGKRPKARQFLDTTLFTRWVSSTWRHFTVPDRSFTNNLRWRGEPLHVRQDLRFRGELQHDSFPGPSDFGAARHKTLWRAALRLTPLSGWSG